MRSRPWPRSAGRRSEKTAAPTRQIVPPAATVAGAPMRSASAPAKSAPKGAMPMNIIE